MATESGNVESTAPDDNRVVELDGAVRGWPAERSVSLAQLIGGVWRGKWIVALTVVIFVALAAGWMKVTTPLYTVSMVLAPAASDDIGGASRKLSGLGAVASLAGINLPVNIGDSKFVYFLNLFYSVTLAAQLAERHDLLRQVFANEWDEATASWQPPGDTLATTVRTVKETLDLPGWQEPSAIRLSNYLRKRVFIQEFDDSGLRRITIEASDPEFGLQLLQLMYGASETILKNKHIKQTEYYIRYLTDQLELTTLAEHRLALTTLLSEQQKLAMMARVELPFAAEMFDPPQASPVPTYPRVIMTFVIAVILGGALGVLIALSRSVALVDDRIS